MTEARSASKPSRTLKQVDARRLRGAVTALESSILSARRAAHIDLALLSLPARYGALVALQSWCNALPRFDSSELVLAAAAKDKFAHPTDSGRFYFQGRPHVLLNRNCKEFRWIQTETIGRTASMASFGYTVQVHELTHLGFHLAGDYLNGPEFLLSSLTNPSVPPHLAEAAWHPQAKEWLEAKLPHSLAWENPDEAIAYLGELQPRESTVPVLSAQIQDRFARLFGGESISADDQRALGPLVGDKGRVDEVEVWLQDGFRATVALRSIERRKAAVEYLETSAGRRLLRHDSVLIDVTGTLGTKRLVEINSRGNSALLSTTRGEPVLYGKRLPFSTERITRQVFMEKGSSCRRTTQLAPEAVERLCVSVDAALHLTVAEKLGGDWRLDADGKSLVLESATAPGGMVAGLPWLTEARQRRGSHLLVSQPPLADRVLASLHQTRSSGHAIGLPQPNFSNGQSLS